MASKCILITWFTEHFRCQLLSFFSNVYQKLVVKVNKSGKVGNSSGKPLAPQPLVPQWGPLLYRTGAGAKDCWHFPWSHFVFNHPTHFQYIYIHCGRNPEVWSGQKMQVLLVTGAFQLWTSSRGCGIDYFGVWSPQRQQCAAELTCCSCVRAPLGESLSPLLVSPQLPFPKEKKRRSRSREEGRRHYRGKLTESPLPEALSCGKESGTRRFSAHIWKETARRAQRSGLLSGVRGWPSVIMSAQQWTE